MVLITRRCALATASTRNESRTNNLGYARRSRFACHWNAKHTEATHAVAFADCAAIRKDTIFGNRLPFDASWLRGGPETKRNISFHAPFGIERR